jgi:hypothetical protein
LKEDGEILPRFVPGGPEGVQVLPQLQAASLTLSPYFVTVTSLATTTSNPGVSALIILQFGPCHCITHIPQEEVKLILSSISRQTSWSIGGNISKVRKERAVPQLIRSP